ncbi:Prefoldin subunit 5 [Perkinsus olseni]|uniref:Prefoldin subunit 5 n=1 Tax=Perkinsus olseni TaxID=32597 RepID=A0A7J6UB53_PEROL|nr:Prefoldin subunit 5 [Perkinsus olseni]
MYRRILGLTLLIIGNSSNHQGIERNSFVKKDALRGVVTLGKWVGDPVAGLLDFAVGMRKGTTQDVRPTHGEVLDNGLSSRASSSWRSHFLTKVLERQLAPAEPRLPFAASPSALTQFAFALASLMCLDPGDLSDASAVPHLAPVLLPRRMSAATSSSAPSTVNPTQLSLPELNQHKQRLEQEVGQLTDTLTKLRVAQQAYDMSARALGGVSADKDEGKETLVPLSNSVYVRDILWRNRPRQLRNTVRIAQG